MNAMEVIYSCECQSSGDAKTVTKKKKNKRNGRDKREKYGNMSEGRYKCLMGS